MTYSMAARVAVPIAEGEFTGVVEIWSETPSREESLVELDARIEELARHVEDMSLRAVLNVDAEELGFVGVGALERW